MNIIIIITIDIYIYIGYHKLENSFTNSYNNNNTNI